MAINYVRAKGRPPAYRFNRGGMPAEFGPFIGIVKNNVDTLRTGRLQVFLENYTGGDPTNKSLWRTVSYVSPFYGTTVQFGTTQGVGSFAGNQQSYGMWFTPPDIETRVVCFFDLGDPNQGYWIGCVVEPGLNHMVPAIGASRSFEFDGGSVPNTMRQATQLPVTEINVADPGISDNPRFYDQTKPVHTYVAALMMQQGLITDNTRGPITSNSQRESPSRVFGISTPGRPIYNGGLLDTDIQGRLDSESVRATDVTVIARVGGHSLVMDDGDIEGRDNLIRLRTAKGHQITMSDDGDCFYFIHANGQTWLEFGKQGTVDVFSENSVNVRTRGTINLHADQDINMFAGGDINVRSRNLRTETQGDTAIQAQGRMTLYSETAIGVLSDGSLALKNAGTGSWGSDGLMNLKGSRINLNGPAAQNVTAPNRIRENRLDDTDFQPQQGWVVEPNKLVTIVTRAPTHEPWPYHNQGVNAPSSATAPVPAVPSPSVASAVGNLQGVAVSAPVNVADVVQQARAELPVASLDTAQTTALMAQAAKVSNQAANAISADRGLGTYGLQPAQLEEQGYLKPGTVNTFLQNNQEIQKVLTTPQVWTGKDGVAQVSSLLTNSRLQGVIYNSSMVQSLSQLSATGVVTGRELPQVLAPLVQTATKFSPEAAADWARGSAPESAVTAMNQVAKGAQFASNLAQQANTQLALGLAGLGGFVGSFNRGDVNAAIQDVIRNPKVPVPNFDLGIYSGTPTSELTYSGDDPLVIERINRERERRGLPPLPDTTSDLG